MFVGKKESPLRTFHNKSRDTNPRNFKRCRRYSADIASFIYTKLVYDALKQKAHSRNAHKHKQHTHS